MRIKHIQVKNFRSFKEIDIDLKNFNVLIGANASGKSNFVNLFEFFNNFANYGIDDAISLLGGIRYLGNLYSPSERSSIRIEIDVDEEFDPFYRIYEINLKKISINVEKFEYELEIIQKKKVTYDINEERLTFYVEFIEAIVEENKLIIQKKNLIGNGRVIISRRGSELIDIEVIANKDINFAKELENEIKDLLDKIPNRIKRKKSLIKSGYILDIDLHQVEDIFKQIRIYNINSNNLKKLSEISGKSELESDGKNMAIVLRKILDNANQRQKLFGLVEDILPFIKKIGVRRTAHKFLSTIIREKYSNNITIPGTLMSDGTINILALIIILYFEKNSFSIIEEPERNIHPYLISKIIDYMKDVAFRFDKQIIITTHNPEIVKYAGLDNLFLIKRDNLGNSIILKPSLSEDVREFLKNEMGLDELFVSNFLK